MSKSAMIPFFLNSILYFSFLKNILHKITNLWEYRVSIFYMKIIIEQVWFFFKKCSNEVQNIVRDKVDKWTNGYKASTLTSSLSKSNQITRTKQTWLQIPDKPLIRI